VDEIIELYKKGVDVTLIRKNLKLTVQQRFEQFMSLQALAAEFRRAGQAHREANRGKPIERDDR
jgi:hypothetical protein